MSFSHHSVSEKFAKKTSFKYWVKETHLDDWRYLLAQADYLICQMASDTGIDWQALRYMLPDEKMLLTGGKVPSLTIKDKGRCAFKWWLKTDRFGRYWPCLWFMSFRHGGVRHFFNGYRWSWQKFQQGEAFLSLPVAMPQKRENSYQQDEAALTIWREKNHDLHKQLWARAEPVQVEHPYIQRRLGKSASSLLLGRISLRVHPEKSNDLMVVLHHHSRSQHGFQVLHADIADNGRKHDLVIRQAGTKKGALAVIHAEHGYEHWPVGICEGVFTALSVATAWPGPIAIALDAGNLAAVRERISRACVFFADNDAWKNHNTGLLAAQQAARQEDRICLPQFAAHTHSHCPTDFNDLLRWQGEAELKQQIGQFWPRG